MPNVIAVADSAGSRNALSLRPRAFSGYSLRFVGRPTWVDLKQHVGGERDVYTITLYAWTEDEVFRAIRLQRPLERSVALRALAGQAWASIEASRNADVDAWARRIADDVADAKD